MRLPRRLRPHNWVVKPERIICAGYSAWARQDTDGKWVCSRCGRPVGFRPVHIPPLLIRSGMPFTPRVVGEAVSPHGGTEA